MFVFKSPSLLKWPLWIQNIEAFNPYCNIDKRNFRAWKIRTWQAVLEARSRRQDNPTGQPKHCRSDSADILKLCVNCDHGAAFIREKDLIPQCVKRSTSRKFSIMIPSIRGRRRARQPLFCTFAYSYNGTWPVSLIFNNDSLPSSYFSIKACRNKSNLGS